jgi:argininosuccinate lyase
MSTTAKRVAANLMSGCHRDFQCTKGPLMRSFDVTRDSLCVTALIVREMIVDTDTCDRACTSDLYATERVYALVRQGVSFRDAYRQVAVELFDRDE